MLIDVFGSADMTRALPLFLDRFGSGNVSMALRSVQKCRKTAKESTISHTCGSTPDSHDLFHSLSSDHATLQNSTQSLPYLLPALHKERGKLRVEHHWHWGHRTVWEYTLAHNQLRLLNNNDKKSSYLLLSQQSTSHDILKVPFHWWMVRPLTSRWGLVSPCTKFITCFLWEWQKGLIYAYMI